MSDVQDASSGQEPSMEEILASIRRIIADEKDPAAAEGQAPTPEEDVVELTQVVQEDGSVDKIDVIEAAPTPAPEPIPEPMPEPNPAPVKMNGVAEDHLVSDNTADTAASSLSALAHTVEIERRASVASSTPLGDGGRTLEEMVVDLMRPLLKAWLDENLPPIVDRAVQKEVERISKRVQE